MSKVRRFRPREHGRGRMRWFECQACERRFPTMEFPVVSARDAEAAEELA